MSSLIQSSIPWKQEFLSIPEIKQVNTKSGRFYVVEDSAKDDYSPSDKFYSITNVLGDNPEKKKTLNAWRNRVGHETANKISRFSAGRGTKVHKIFEDYLKGASIDKGQLFPHILPMVSAGIHIIEQNISSVYHLEKRLVSKKLRVAGTVDGIIEWNWVPAILDFKTARRPKRKEWIEDFFLQCTAYSIMLKELTGQEFDLIIIFIVVEGQKEPQIFVESAKKYKPLLLKRVWEFYGRRPSETFPEIFLKKSA